jgi:glycosyl transferase, family 25
MKQSERKVRADMWPVYVINMADNVARMQSCTSALNALGIPFERFEAVNGRALSDAKASAVYDADANQRMFRLPLVRGELGCYLSHIELWRRIAAGNADGAIILEDDFTASPHFPQVLAALIADQDPWDMVKLFARRRNKVMLNRRNLCDGFEIARPYQIPNTTLGYVIRRDAAGRLLARSAPFARPIDEDHKRFWEHGLDVRLVMPPPLSLNADLQHSDTIQATRKSLRGGSLAVKLKQGLRNFKYRFIYLTALHVNRLRGR